jgi:hypothetical protein
MTSFTNKNEYECLSGLGINSDDAAEYSDWDAPAKPTLVTPEKVAREAEAKKADVKVIASKWLETTPLKTTKTTMLDYFPSLGAKSPKKVAREAEAKKADVKVIASKWLETTPLKTTKTTMLDDFPSLGTKSPKEKQKQKQTGPVGSKVNKMKKLVITGKTYSEQKHEERRGGVAHNVGAERRTSAFEVLADKECLNDKLTKTQMCNSVGRGNGKCWHRNCRYAHNIDELRLSECLFGDKCRLMHTPGGRYNKKCIHKHPQESRDEYMIRTGNVSKSKTKVSDTELHIRETRRVVKAMETPANENIWKTLPVDSEDEIEIILEKPKPREIKPLYQLPKFSAEQLARMKTDETEIEIEAPKMVPQVVAPKMEETVLRVPKELAMQAMELAMKSGRTNIRVEIV